MLSAAGGALGLALVAAALQALIAFAPSGIPRLGEARIDPQVLLFTLAVSLFSSIVSGLWPALRNGTMLARSRQWTTIANRGSEHAGGWRIFDRAGAVGCRRSHGA